MNSNGATSRLMPEAAPDAENVTVEIARFVVRRVDGVGNGVKQAQQYPCHNECLSEWGYGIEINAGGGNLKRGKEYGRCNENGAEKRAVQWRQCDSAVLDKRRTLWYNFSYFAIITGHNWTNLGLQCQQEEGK